MAIGDDLKTKLAQAPTYQSALRGQWRAPGVPDTPGLRVQHLRAAAAKDGIVIPAGWAFNGTDFYDANADHWYSDPRVLGPAAVGAASVIGPMLLGPAAIPAATTPAATAPAAAAPAATSPAAVLPAAAPLANPDLWDGNIPNDLPGAGPINEPLPPGMGPLGGMRPNGGDTVYGDGLPSTRDQFLDWIRNPRNIAGLASLTPAIANAARGPDRLLTDDPTVQQLLQMSLKRQQRTDPLHDSVTGLAMAMMPTGYQR